MVGAGSFSFDKRSLHPPLSPRCRYISGTVHSRRAPEISRFYGIGITMYYAEHGVPHFPRAVRRLGVIDLDCDSHVIEGQISRRAMALVEEWARQHNAELLENWERARRHEPLARIAALD